MRLFLFSFLLVVLSCNSRDNISKTYTLDIDYLGEFVGEIDYEFQAIPQPDQQLLLVDTFRTSSMEESLALLEKVRPVWSRLAKYEDAQGAHGKYGSSLVGRVQLPAALDPQRGEVEMELQLAARDSYILFSSVAMVYKRGGCVIRTGVVDPPSCFGAQKEKWESVQYLAYHLQAAARNAFFAAM